MHTFVTPNKNGKVIFGIHYNNLNKFLPLNYCKTLNSPTKHLSPLTCPIWNPCRPVKRSGGGDGETMRCSEKLCKNQSNRCNRCLACNFSGKETMVQLFRCEYLQNFWNLLQLAFVLKRIVFMKNSWKHFCLQVFSVQFNYKKDCDADVFLWVLQVF